MEPNGNISASLRQLVARASAVSSAGDHGDMLGALRLLEWTVRDARRVIVSEARVAGFTWQQIGDWLGITRQAAQQQYSDLD